MVMNRESKVEKRCRELGGDPGRLGEWLADQLNLHGSVENAAKAIGVSRQVLSPYVPAYKLCRRWTICD